MKRPRTRRDRNTNYTQVTSPTATELKILDAATDVRDHLDDILGGQTNITLVLIEAEGWRLIHAARQARRTA